ncbi:MAG: hypothetical protein V3U07_05710 [Nitrospirales bacterium]
MKRFHRALGIVNIEPSVLDYSQRLGQDPNVVIPHEYALWRTDTLNLSIRKVSAEESRKLRHLGWETPDTKEFSTEMDNNGILWEHFTAHQQADEINQIWPDSQYHPKP